MTAKEGGRSCSQGSAFFSASGNCFMLRKLLCLTILCSLPVLATAADKESEAAIRAAVQSYVEAYNVGDAKRVAEHWAEDAEYQLPSGERVQGREAIQKAFAETFAGDSPPKIDLVEARVRIVGNGVGIEEGVVRVLSADGGAEETGYLAVHVLQGESWKLASVNEQVLKQEPLNESASHLQDLDWLVGHWQEKVGESVADVRFSWAKNRSFLTCQFRTPLAVGEPLEGSQVIGWDPESKVIRSWIFDADGGFGEGLWTATEQGWAVEMVQVLPDGRRASATNTYSRVDANTFEWRSTNRQIDGQGVPDIGPIKAIRKISPDPKAPASE